MTVTKLPILRIDYLESTTIDLLVYMKVQSYLVQSKIAMTNLGDLLLFKSVDRLFI